MLPITPAEKKFQGSRPQSTKMGNFSIWLLGNITVKTAVKTIIMASGLSRLHKNPNAVFLYRVLSSRRVKLWINPL